MEILNKTFTSEEYHMNCDLKTEKKIDITMVWKLCEVFPDSKVVNLDFFDEDGSIVAEYDSWVSKDFDLFKNECISANINIKDPLYWELIVEYNHIDITIGYDEYDEQTMYLYADGTKDELEEILKIVSKVDRHIEVVK